MSNEQQLIEAIKAWASSGEAIESDGGPYYNFGPALDNACAKAGFELQLKQRGISGTAVILVPIQQL